MTHGTWAFLVVMVALTAAGRGLCDDAVINTPIVTANLKGEWVLSPAGKEAYKQRLTLGGQLTGEWQMDKKTLPVTLAWFVEGGELRLMYYHEPKEVSNYRVKELRYKY